MDARIDLNRQPSPTDAPTTGAANEAISTPSASSAHVRKPLPSAPKPNAAPPRESIDPMRSTDRYRLVHPMSSEI